ncbi:DUF4339 domain-containing protein, partial [Mariniblastus sp.]|nr:DUF4339 domain-containing protein [Mariniblastus sp.]
NKSHSTVRRVKKGSRCRQFRRRRKLRAPKCNHKFVINPTAKSSPKPPPPLNPPSQSTEDEQWHVLDGNGQQYGPFDFNDVQNYASQGRLSLDTSVRHQTRTKDKWVSVTRVPEITELMQTAASLQIQLAGASAASHKAVNPDFPRTATVPILVSAICNILVALIWIGTCFGIPLGFACIALCVCEFVVFSKRESYNREQFRSVTLWLAIFEIIVGLINIVSFVCGIVVLVTRPPKNA